MDGNRSVFNWQLWLGFVLVVTGGLFLVDQLLGTEIMNNFWPLLIVLFGLTFFVGMLFAGKRGAGLAIPGSIIVVGGLLLFVQRTFDLWITWTYAWGLLISAAGLGLLIMNVYIKRVGLRRAAGVVMGVGLILFVAFGVLFEIALNIAGTNVNTSLFLGGGLILLGLFIVLSRPLFAAPKQKPEEEKRSGEVVEATAVEVEPEEQAVEEFESAAAQQMEEPSAAPVNYQPLGEEAQFTNLYFKSVGEIILVQGDLCKLEIEGTPELVDKIKATVEDDTLSITFEPDSTDWNNLLWIGGEGKVKYRVTVKDLHSVVLAGAASLQSDSLQGENLNISNVGFGKILIQNLQYQEIDINLDGMGEIDLAGEVQFQNVNLEGAGTYKAIDLRSQDANVSLSGAGSARVWAETHLVADLSGAGSIKYKGEPTVEKSSSGLGSIKAL